MTKLALLPCLFLVACGGGSEDSDDTSGGTSTSATTSETTTAACQVLESGRWRGKGAAFGMNMDADLAFDEATCSFTLSNWDMAMSVPEGGTLDGTDLTLTGDSYWSTCTGSAPGKRQFSGTCDGGDDFEMSLL